MARNRERVAGGSSWSWPWEWEWSCISVVKVSSGSCRVLLWHVLEESEESEESEQVGMVCVCCHIYVGAATYMKELPHIYICNQ